MWEVFPISPVVCVFLYHFKTKKIFILLKASRKFWCNEMGRLQLLINDFVFQHWQLLYVTDAHPRMIIIGFCTRPTHWHYQLFYRRRKLTRNNLSSAFRKLCNILVSILFPLLPTLPNCHFSSWFSLPRFNPPLWHCKHSIQFWFPTLQHIPSFWFCLSAPPAIPFCLFCSVSSPSPPSFYPSSYFQVLYSLFYFVCFDSLFPLPTVLLLPSFSPIFCSFLSSHHFVLFPSLSKVKLATVVEGNQKAPFSIATTLRCRGGHYSFPRIAPLYPWYVPYIVPFLKVLVLSDLGLNPSLPVPTWSN